jgi:hypothetical protein
VSDATLNEGIPHDARKPVQGTHDNPPFSFFPYISVGHLQESKPTPPFPIEKDLAIAPVKLASHGKHSVIKLEFNSI